MMLQANPYRAKAAPQALSAAPTPSDDAQHPLGLLARCPDYKPTPLVALPELAKQLGIDQLWVKNEALRMNMNSFKALGAAYVVACDAQKANFAPLAQRCYITASAGNHGLSLAMGAKLFGAKAVIVLSQAVPASFAARLKALGAQVVIYGQDYQASMDHAMHLAQQQGYTLVSDSSWPGYTQLPSLVMQGYLVLADEFCRTLGDNAPSHVFLQAGVGGLAAACAAYIRKVWGAAPRIIVVEPDAAPALLQAIRAGKVVDTQGPASNMGRLDCKTASMIALKGLARDADYFMTISDQQAESATETFRKHQLGSSPSGAAGLGGLLALSEQQRAELGLDQSARVLLINSEGEA